MAAQTQVRVRPADQIVVLEIEGDLNSSSEAAMSTAYQEAAADCKKLLLSFRDQDFINSAGIAILIELVSQSRQDDVSIRIAHPSEHFRKIFEMVGLNRYVSVFATVEEAQQDF